MLLLKQISAFEGGAGHTSIEMKSLSFVLKSSWVNVFIACEPHYHILSHQTSNDEALDWIIFSRGQVCVLEEKKYEWDSH